MSLFTTEVSKERYYSRISKKLMDSSASPYAYWSLFKTFLISQKIPCIPPLFHNNKFISNFRDKVEVFNNFLSQQCTLIDSAIEIPARLNIKTIKTLSSIPITRADIAKIIKSLDPDKAHGHDMISIWMLKLCGDSTLPPLEFNFKSCLESGTFPSVWKKANVVPVHKKSEKIIGPYHYSLFVEKYLNE